MIRPINSTIQNINFQAGIKRPVKLPKKVTQEVKNPSKFKTYIKNVVDDFRTMDEYSKDLLLKSIVYLGFLSALIAKVLVEVNAFIEKFESLFK